MNWFSQYGDRVLGLLSLAAAILTANAQALHLDPVAFAWITVGGSFATAAHTFLFPNAPPPPAAPSK